MEDKITELTTSNTEIKVANEKIQTQNKELQVKVDGLNESNTKIQAENQEMKASNQELRNLLAMQSERLERLEQIALGNQKDGKTAFSFLNTSNLFSSLRGFLISRN